MSFPRITTLPLSLPTLITGQQDIAYDESGGSFGIGGTQQQTTCIGGYMLGGTFVAIVGDGITQPSHCWERWRMTPVLNPSRVS